jgi:hypothetical protein
MKGTTGKSDDTPAACWTTGSIQTFVLEISSKLLAQITGSIINLALEPFFNELQPLSMLYPEIPS